MILSSLYEINAAIMSCVDMETGEIIDPDALDALMMQKTEKIEAVALWIKNLQADAAAYKAEKDSFAKREQQATKKAEQLKRWLTYSLNGEKFTTTKCAISFRKSTVLDIVDKALIPEKFMVSSVTVAPDANAIKAALKEGQAVDGCRLVENQNIQLK